LFPETDLVLRAEARAEAEELPAGDVEDGVDVPAPGARHGARVGLRVRRGDGYAETSRDVVHVVTRRGERNGSTTVT
jgi:hypothetical protein